MNNRRFFLTLAYLGTDFHGWQSQKKGERTVQDVLEASLTRLYGRRFPVTAAGRTDAGVHAEGQVAHVTVPDTRVTGRLQDAMNALLPWDLKVMELTPMAPGAHARRDSFSKTYRYQILLGRVHSPFLQHTWHRIPFSLDTEALRECATILTGKHDFASFTPSAHLYATTQREILSTSVETDGPKITITFTGRGFLRYMVRRMVGTMVEVARGARTTRWIQDLLLCRPQCEVGPRAPAHGLVLEKVTYPAACYNAPDG